MNGELVKQSSPKGMVGEHVNPDRIGSYEQMSFWEVQIDDVQIWNRELDVSEIKVIVKGQ